MIALPCAVTIIAVDGCMRAYSQLRKANVIHYAVLYADPQAVMQKLWLEAWEVPLPELHHFLHWIGDHKTRDIKAALELEQLWGFLPAMPQDQLPVHIIVPGPNQPGYSQRKITSGARWATEDQQYVLVQPGFDRNAFEQVIDSDLLGRSPSLTDLAGIVTIVYNRLVIDLRCLNAGVDDHLQVRD